MVDTPGAEAPSSPDITHVEPASEQRPGWAIPRQLARLFSVEMWERFGFYGMRALLVLYLVKHFLLQQYQASGIVGGYLSLVYLTPVIGGWLADYYLGSKRSVKWGALVMAAGYLLLCFGGDQAKPYATIGGQRYEVQVDRGSIASRFHGHQAVGRRERTKASDPRHGGRIGPAPRRKRPGLNRRSPRRISNQGRRGRHST